MTRAWLALLALCACHGLGPKRFPARYQREGDSAPTAPECASFSKIIVKDARPQPELVGDRTREDNPTIYAVTMLGNSAAWGRAGIESQARAS